MNFSNFKKANFYKQISTDNVLLILILLVATVLRFYNFNEIPYINDELSALFRARFDTFGELIEKGVLIDGHPAGVQVFLYYWIKIFGTSEFAVKLPFMIMGVFSVLYIYKIARFWFNSSVGLIAASFLSCLQYTVMFSQIQRPYGSGIFIALALVWFWTGYFLGENKFKIKNISGFIVFGALSAYNHHFSLLLLGLLGIMGLFFIKKDNYRLYLLSGVVIFILYLPHLRIFFYQLNVGGVGGPNGWLAPPENDFIYKYLKYVFHFSKLMYLLTFIVICTGVFLFFKNKEYKNNLKMKFRIISFMLFALSFLIGFYYSIYKAAVLQYSVLIFSFPFLLIFLFSFYSELSKIFKITLVMSILIISTYSLIKERKHYEIFYHQGFRECVNQTLKFKESGNSCAVLFNGYEDFYLNYYEKLFNKKTNALNFNIDTVSIYKFSKMVKAQHTDNLIWASPLPTNLFYQEIIKESFPYLINKSLGFGYEVYLFSKNKSTITDAAVFKSCLSFDKSEQFWNYDINNVINDSIVKNKACEFKTDQEWGPLFEAKLKDILSNKFNYLYVSVKTKLLNKNANPMLVVSIENEKKECLSWHTSDFKDFLHMRIDGKVYLSLRMADIADFNLNDNLKVYIWNKQKDNFIIDDFEIRVETGNPLFYSLVTDF